MKSERIDVMQEFVDLYQHEELLAFFEFSIERPGGAPVNGLCKISQPKAGDTGGLSDVAAHSDQRERPLRKTLAAGPPAAGPRYLSLTFMADAPDDASTATIEAAFAGLDREAFQHALPSVDAVVPVPSLTRGAELNVRQFDLMLNPRLDPGETFVMERLLPALRSFAGLHAHHVVWWDGKAQTAAGGAEVAAAAPEPRSVLGSLRSYLKRVVDSERK